jgi:hypothetical protein
VHVQADDDRPTMVNGSSVVSLREEWRVLDRWWTERPVRRRYFDVVLDSGENVVVFLDEMSAQWFRQRA